jgi:hypothetical protein
MHIMLLPEMGKNITGEKKKKKGTQREENTAA